FIPVVNSTYYLEGIVSRQDILIALNEVQRQPQAGETIDDLSTRDLMTSDEKPTIFEVHVTPQMSNQLGTLSNCVLSTLITEASGRLLLHYKKGNMVVESLNIYVIEPVQMDSDLTIIPELLDAGRLYAKIKAEVWNNKKLVCKGMLMAQLIDR